MDSKNTINPKLARYAHDGYFLIIKVLVKFCYKLNYLILYLHIIANTIIKKSLRK